MSNEALAAAIQAGQVGLYSDLWAGVERYVYKEAGRWARAWRRPEDEQDLIQCGFLALVDAVGSYEPSKSAFITWFAFHLKKAFSECLDVHGQTDPLQGAVSLDAPVGEDTEAVTLGDTLAGEDCIADADRRLYLEQLRAALGEELAKLPPEQADTLRRRFCDRETRKQIAEAEGLTLYNVQALEQRGLNALRKPRTARRLAQFLDDRTDFYGLHGVHSVEGAVIHREWVEGRFRRP